MGKLATAEEILVGIKGDSSDLIKELEKAGGKVGSFNNKLKSVGKGMTIVGGAITAGFVMAVNTTKKFEQSMANTASVAGATGEELKLLSDYAREMGAQSVYSASEAADAMYYLASAGMGTNEIMGSLKGTLELASATQADLAFTSNTVASALSQFDLEAEEADRVANVFAATISGSQATIEKLSTSMSYVGPMANSMGMEIEDVCGILGNLYNAGYDASMAGTSLRMSFTKLLDPSEESQEVLDRLGVTILDSSGKMKPFAEIIDDLGVKGMSTADSIKLFGQRAGPAMLALVSQGEGAISSFTEKVTGTQKASEMAETQINTFEGAMKLLKSAFEELQICLGTAVIPKLTDFVKWVTEGITKVSEWMKENPKLADTVIKLGAAIGGLCVVGGPILMAISAFSKISGAISALGTLATGPIGLLILAVGGVYLAWKNWDKIVDFVSGFKDKIVSYLGDLKEIAIEKVNQMIDWIMEKFEDLANLPKKMLEWGKNAISGFAEGIKSKLGDFKDSVSGVAGIIKGWLGFESPPKEGVLSDSDKWMPNMMAMFGAGIEANTSLVINPLKKLGIEIKGTIKSGVEASGNLFIDGTKIATVKIKIYWINLFKDIAKNYKSTLDILGNGLKGFVSSFEGVISNGITSLLTMAETNAEIKEQMAEEEEEYKEEMAKLQEEYNQAVMEGDNETAQNALDKMDEIKEKHEEVMEEMEGEQVTMKSIWENFWSDLKSAAISALAQIIAKLVVMKGLMLLFGAFGWVWPFNEGGGVGSNKGGGVKGFTSGGGVDTIPAMLTEGEYVIAKPMTDFIRKFKSIPANLISAIVNGSPTPIPAFAGGGIVGDVNVGSGGAGFGDTNVNVYISGNNISNEIDIKRLAETVGNEILKKLSINRRY